jgi:hypothetical protein
MLLESVLQTVSQQDINKKIETTLSLKLMGKILRSVWLLARVIVGYLHETQHLVNIKKKNQVKSLFILVMTTLVTNLLLKCSQTKSVVQSYSKLSLEEVISSRIKYSESS